MGYLLKEALKTLCGVNQWSYAVFWKIGCQNPKLLIWEDCYYETASCSGLSGNLNPENAFCDFNTSWVSAETRKLQSDVQAGDKVHLLVNKMMMDNHVNIVGEGLVGRVAFTGNHQWIMSENYYTEAHLPEVQKEVCQQFSAGMQTVAVIPVLPHGVVQFGSFLTIMENIGFVNDATSLLLQLGYLTELPKECTLNVVNAPCSFDPFNYIGNSNASSMVDGKMSFSVAREIQNELRSTGAEFQAPKSTRSQIGSHHRAKIDPPMKLDFSSTNQLPKAEVIMNQHSQYIQPTPNLPSCSSSNLNCGLKISSNSANQGYISMPKMPQTTDSGSIYYSDDHDTKWAANGNFISKNQTSGKLKNVIFSKTEAEVIPGFVEDDEMPKSGDDLFDVLGADFKNKLFSNCWNRSSDDSSPNVRSWDKINLLSKKSSPSSELSGIFTSTCTDHLLEAVVSKISPSAKQSLNDDVSCGTTLTNISSSSAPNISLPYGRFGISDHVKGELLGVPTNSCSFATGPSKEESGAYSQGSSIYGSQISSWIDKDQKGKQSNSVSTGYSKKPDETGKTGRKRLKPGENPRPRPKDRQMIQDRVKELREIVPNGAKCSIDSLLERTIKHMLFLQSVTKHADKLKQTGDSKIISKDGGLLLKDNFEGGATWAYEVGSQSMVCPIIVEDLNQPRQMLVEMLCEERGLFLEIADIIRGLGLTILKGVMETRNDKIWARFAVEANRDVTRMEIFISLVRLLEQSAKSAIPQPNGTISGDNSTAQQFHQPAPIPSLQ